MKLKVLITGAHGFIGRYIAKKYNDSRCYVIGMGHGQWSEEEYKKWGLSEWFECDITLDNLLKINKVDVIVHCAGSGSVGFSIQNPMLDFQRTVLSLQDVLEYIRVYSPDTKLIYPSSAAVYGNINSLPIKENASLNPISPYGIDKKIAEDLCKLYSRQYNLSIIIIRLFSVYGNGLKKQLLWDACNKLQAGKTEFWGTGDETRDWVHVVDVADLFYLAQNYVDNSCRIVNCGSGTNVKIKTIIKLLYSNFVKNYELKFNNIIDVGNPHDYLADDSIVISWGWKPEISIEKGMSMYAEWYKAEKDN